MVGLSFPENTLQTFLYAIQHRDAALILQAVAPAQEQRLRAKIDPAADPENGFFKQANAIPGFAVQGRKMDGWLGRTASQSGTWCAIGITPFSAGIR